VTFRGARQSGALGGEDVGSVKTAKMTEETADHGGKAPVSSEAVEWVVLTADERKVLKELKRIKKESARNASSQGRGLGGQGGQSRQRKKCKTIRVSITLLK